MKTHYSFLIFCFSILYLNTFANTPFEENVKPNGFVENCGQIIDQNNAVNTDVNYIWAAGNGLNVQLRSTGISYDTYQKQGSDIAFHRLDMEFVGMNTHATVIGTESFLATESFYSSTSKSNISGVRSFEGVTYTAIYENIDFAVSITEKGQLKYDFILDSPDQADQIKLKYEGFDSFEIADGSLIFDLSGRKITEHIPASWMSKSGRMVKMDYDIIETGCDYVIVGFKTEEHFSEKNEGSLIIDPLAVLEWGTYYGDSLSDVGNAIATDSLGNVFVTGTTASLNRMASSESYQSVFSGGNSDVFIVKFNQHGLRHWATYYGGSGDDKALGIDVDSYGILHIVGSTTSTDSIGSEGSQQIENGGGTDGFVARFDRFGGFVWDSFIGAAGYDEATACVADGNGNVIVVGNTSAGGFLEIDTVPLLNGYQGGIDAFIAKYNSEGKLIFTSYYGGENDDYATAVAVDTLSSFVVAGYTHSPTGVAFGDAWQYDLDGETDGFAVKIDSSGSLTWATYFGGPGNDRFTGVTSVNDNFYFSGYTDSLITYTDTLSAQENYGGNTDAFITRLNAGGLVDWFSYVGGAGSDVANGISRDYDGFVYIVGTTNSDTAITTTADSLAIFPEGENAFVTKFSQMGERIWGEYYGGSATDLGLAIAVYGVTSVYITGLTTSPDGISKNGVFEAAHQTYEPDLDTLAFMARFTQVTSTYPIGCGPGDGGGGGGNGSGGGGGGGNGAVNLPPGVCIGDSILISVHGGALGQGAQWLWYKNACGEDLNFIGEGGSIWVAPESTTTYFVRAESVNCTTRCASVTVFVDYPNTAIASANDSICPGSTLALFGDGGYFYDWFKSDTLVSEVQNPLIDSILPSQAGTYMLVAKTMFGCIDTTTVDVSLLPAPQFDVASSNVKCAGTAGGRIDIVSNDTSALAINWPVLQSDQMYVDSLFAGTYQVIVTNSSMCSASTFITLTEPQPITDSLLLEPSYCALSNGRAQMVLWGGTPPYSYVWQPGNYSGPVIDNLLPGEYSVVFTDSLLCVDSLDFTIPHLGEFTTIIDADSILLDYFSSEELLVYTDPELESPEIVWSPAEGLSCTNCFNPIADPAATTLYTVLITSEYGCTSEDSIFVERELPPPNSFIPTAFSPNGDGLNDMLCVLGVRIKSFNLKIFDRFGKEIFTTSSAENCWDGTIDGAPATGSYIYTFEAVLEEGKTVNETGNITIKR